MVAPQATPLILLSELAEEIAQGSDTTTATRHRRLIVEASDRVQKWCDRRFDEYIDTRYFSAQSFNRGGDVDGVELVLDADLRTITTLTNGDATTIAGTEYQLLPRNEPNKSRIRLDPTSSDAWTYTDDPEGAISVLGTWGYGGQWVNTGTTVASGLAASASVVTFTSSAGASLEVGMVLKIDSEYLYVETIVTNTITVVRGYNGSTAATHVDASVVYRWEAEPVVAEIVKFLVIWRIERMKARLSQQVTLGPTGLPTTLSSAPIEVRDGIRDANLIRKKRIWRV